MKQEQILCACGCGAVLSKYDSRRRPRKFVNGHQGRVKTDSQIQAASKNLLETPSHKGHPWNKDKTYTIGKIEVYSTKGSWCEAAKRTYGDKCMVLDCGWAIAPCDCHHIVPKSEGGKFTLENAIILCPNHHRMAQVGLISTSELKNIKEVTRAICRRTETL